MNFLKACFLLAFTSLLIFSCNKDEEPPTDFLSEFESIPETKYKTTDTFLGEQSDIYDTWKAVRNEQGGVAGVFELPTNFDFLLVKPNGIFGIVRNDSLITSGEIVKIENTDDLFQIKFEQEESSEDLDVRILNIDRITVRIDDEGTMKLMYSTSSTVLTNNF